MEENSRMDEAWSTAHANFLSSLSDEEIAALTSHAKRLSFKKQDQVFAAGDDARTIYLVARGCINSEKEDVSSVHAGLFYTVDLAATGMDHDAIAERVTEQAEPWKVQWVAISEVAGVDDPPAPQDGQWEDWTRIALTGI